ncbi:MAG: HPF/RaiA family ribosome-associated protein [Methylibium sp.]|nr:HPF/RaiA family ribosome-associated protein [Methylibium sp.]
MKLYFCSNDLEGKLWQQRAADRLRQALRRLHGLVVRIKVRLDDINGPAGGVDKRCHVELVVRGNSPVAVTATARSWQDSVEAVASRVRQRVVVQLHRATSVEHQAMVLAPIRARVAAPAARPSTQRRLRLD